METLRVWRLAAGWNRSAVLRLSRRFSPQWSAISKHHSFPRLENPNTPINRPPNNQTTRNNPHHAYREPLREPTGQHPPAMSALIPQPRKLREPFAYDLPGESLLRWNTTSHSSLSS